MIRCARCGRDNQEGASGCSQCGALLPRRAPVPVLRPVTDPRALRHTPVPGQPCPTCRQQVPGGFRFCGACGTPVPSPSPSPAARTPRPGATGPAVAIPRPASARARISLLGRDGAVLSSVTLVQEETTLGQRGEVPLADPHAAAVQGRLVFRGPRLFLRPDDVPNGTFLLLRQELPLEPGSELRVGRQLLRIDARSPARPTPGLWGSPNPGHRLAAVQILAGGEEGDVFPLREGDNLVGRAAGDLTFPGDGYVSGRHAVITVQGGRASVRDLGSSNGTFVRLHAEAELAPGDLLLVGEQLLRVEGA